MSTATRTTLEWISTAEPISVGATIGNSLPANHVVAPAAAESIKLDPAFTPWFPAFAPWLAAVERRISAATLPDGYQGMEQSSWISEEVGAAAIRFFQNAADILPSEPFIYGSKSGALVAEFAAANGALTTVISPNVTTFFAATKNDPEDPIQVTVRKGSNRLREELRGIAQALTGTNGQAMGPSR
jgi:hypothetical protein